MISAVTCALDLDCVPGRLVATLRALLGEVLVLPGRFWGDDCLVRMEPSAPLIDL